MNVNRNKKISKIVNNNSKLSSSSSSSVSSSPQKIQGTSNIFINLLRSNSIEGNSTLPIGSSPGKHSSIANNNTKDDYTNTTTPLHTKRKGSSTRTLPVTTSTSTSTNVLQKSSQLSTLRSSPVQVSLTTENRTTSTGGSRRRL